ncbi:MAG: aminotransferase DegT [Ignavibacteria bacterium RBG_16_34_14]|nr:MAG: aminotransferase DegT [Ignavibacteria bacterium RBG_16_34_14]
MDAVHVTKPFLPPLKEFIIYLEKLWETGIFTHNGPLLNQFEQELQNYLNIENVVCVSNGTIAIQLAIKALALHGEIITTPFTFIATADAILWEKCKPVFVDIDPETLNISTEEIEKNITENTVAILAVHVFGNPCDVKKIHEISQKYNLRVIYDGAHAMGVRIDGKTLFSYGDISTVSFHATKLLQTFEGGAVITESGEIARKLKRLRFFGYEGRDIVDEGFNGKMTEVSAAMGLVNLKYLDEVISRRKKLYEIYQMTLCPIKKITLQKINPKSFNYSYFPVIFEREQDLLKVEHRLKESNIHPRRYFYPSLNTLDFFPIKTYTPNSERIAKNILCLPLYDSLPEETVQMIANLIVDVI